MVRAYKLRLVIKKSDFSITVLSYMEEKRSLTPAQIQYLRIGPKVCNSSSAAKHLQDTIDQYTFYQIDLEIQKARIMYHFRVFLNLLMETSSTLLAISVFYFNVILLEFLPCIRHRNSDILPIKWTGKCKVKKMFQLMGRKEVKENL